MGGSLLILISTHNIVLHFLPLPSSERRSGVPRVTTQREELAQELLSHGVTQSSKRVDLLWFHARKNTNSIEIGGKVVDIPGFSSSEQFHISSAPLQVWGIMEGPAPR